MQPGPPPRESLTRLARRRENPLLLGEDKDCRTTTRGFWTRRKEENVHCARLDGSMQSYEEKLDSMSQFIVRTQGLDEVEARKTAKSMMAGLPAWKDA